MENDAVRGMGSSGAAESRSQTVAPSSRREDREEYAATGMGNKVNHDVERVYMDLERSPFATVDVRYEFHDALVKLGVFPSRDTLYEPLDRREKSRGFGDDDYCPEP